MTPLPATASSVPPLRPGWMRLLAVLCAATVVATLSGDLFVPAARAVEVWGGFEITGWLATATAPIHWAMFAFASWAFWTGRAWIVPWFSAYLVYAAISHVVWSEMSPHGRGWPIGLLQGLILAGIGWLLLRLRDLDPTTRA